MSDLISYGEQFKKVDIIESAKEHAYRKVNGSNNWTSTANYNEETFATALDYELVAKFATQFMELYNKK